MRSLARSRRRMMVGEKRKLDLTGFKDPYDPGYSDDKECEYVSGEDMDVDDGNFGSFKAKEKEKIRAKRDAYYYNRKTNTWRCPYCTTKPKRKSDRFVDLLTHAEDVTIHGDDYKIRGQHGALVEVLTPLPK
ncbi:lrr receptor-like serine threonine-protein kinase [Hordeum vulgare]|nr:lrr receptor-like serine threonine-protein kinase [Hordeum vulgare]